MKQIVGKWTVKHSESKPAFNVIGTVPGGKYKIARCPYIVLDEAENINKIDKEEAEANAKLIAAAPDLLEALQQCNEFISWALDAKIFNYSKEVKKSVDAIQKAEAAIKKATE